MRAAIYTRISADVVGDSHGVDQQERECRDLADRRGWQVVRTFSDNDISAYSGKARPGYESLLALMEAGGVDAVVAWHTDRLHRSLTDLERFIGVCQSRSIRIETVRAGSIDLTTPSGQMVAGMLAVAARHEVGHMIERQTASHVRRAAEGKFRGGRRRFGFEADHMTLVEEEAAAIREGVAQLLAGASIGSVARGWNAAGLTGTAGKPWSSTTVRRTLQRAGLAGLAERHGEVVGKGRWPAIISEADWRAVCAVLRDPDRRQHPRERRWQGSGHYECGKCGAAMQAGRTPKGVSIYRCSKSPHLSRAAVALDEFVTGLVVARMSQPDAVAVLTPDEAVDVAGLQVRRDALTARLRELAGLFADGAIDASQLRIGTDGVRKQVEALDVELSAARMSSPLVGLAVPAGEVEEVWSGLAPDIRGKVIGALMRVEVLPLPVGQRNRAFDPSFVRVSWRTAP